MDQEIEFNINYPKSPDKFIFAGTFIYSEKIVAVKRFLISQVRFRI
jgi:hypothetical protein